MLPLIPRTAGLLGRSALSSGRRAQATRADSRTGEGPFGTPPPGCLGCERRHRPAAIRRGQRAQIWRCAAGRGGLTVFPCASRAPPAVSSRRLRVTREATSGREKGDTIVEPIVMPGRAEGGFGCAADEAFRASGDGLVSDASYGLPFDRSTGRLVLFFCPWGGGSWRLYSGGAFAAARPCRLGSGPSFWRSLRPPPALSASRGTTSPCPLSGLVTCGF
jgi:hypothetical protein